MSNLRSSSTSLSKNEHDRPLFLDRRPSWTSQTEQDDLRTAKSHSKRRPRKTDESHTRSPEWNSSLLLARRPSFAPSLDEAIHRARSSRTRHVEEDGESSPESTSAVPIGPGLPESPEEGKGFKSSWEINVKDLVGDAVGNMSISPTSRDIVLAARRGLFIIDLESPFNIPRFLPQGGTWDVADVQWNPHPSHSQYIVSTSSEKMLIWNLRFGGKTSIEHILKSHYRAITDINWHTTECDIVVSTGIDSWVWAWDIRIPRKPIFGYCAFNAGGTQVKWNHQDSNLLASSHADEVLIWDWRKGSLPVSKIRAHASLIYGIDWSRHSRDEITTCSLDKTIKTWDVNAASSTTNPQPKHIIHTSYPVWRARNLPFGDGILSLPQRGETTLEMYAKSETQTLVETFEGHSDVVREFVWRKGPQDDFQLVTWSKDRTLRFWPVDAGVMERVGSKPHLNRGRSKLTRREQENESFTTFTLPLNPEIETNDFFNDYFTNAFSAPMSANRMRPLPQPLQINLHSGQLGQETPPASDTERADTTPTLTSSKPITIDASGFASALSRSVAESSGISRSATGQGETMSKAGTGSKSVAKVDQLAWLASFRVGGKRGYSSGTSNSEGNGSNGNAPKEGGSGSGGGSRLSSTSRTEEKKSDRSPSKSDLGARHRQRSGSLSRAPDDRGKEVVTENNQPLNDEITSVLIKLANSKIKLEKLDLSSKKRTCTLGLHGPWGESSSVFMRVTFTFPRDYPQEAHPYGTPTVELERNPLIHLRDRAFILKHLRRIRERKRPCLEACLRFLLFAIETRDEEDNLGDSDEEDSSDEDLGLTIGASKKHKKRDFTISLLRNSKNLTEPRTSQGAFGPNGELICFFRAAPRIVRRDIRGASEDSNTKGEDSTSIQDGPQQSLSSQQPKTSYFQSPALVADAVRRLGLAATDRTVQPIDPRHPEAGITILKAMTNLLTVSQPQQQRIRRDREMGGDPMQNHFGSVKRSTVFLLSTRNIAGADQKAGKDYIFSVGGGSLAEVCERNADFAKLHGRFDHERVFRTLKTLFRQPQNDGDKWRPLGFSSDHLAKEVITRLYGDAAAEKDIQLLAMISMLVLQTEHGRLLPRSTIREKSHTPAPSATPRSAGFDYFSLTKPAANPISPIQFAWSRMPTPPNQRQMHPPPSISSSNSSKGSWSSLFNTGTMRQFMNGVQDTFKEGLLTPAEILSTTTPDIHITGTLPPNTSPVGKGNDRKASTPDSPIGANKKKRVRKDSSLVISPPSINLSKSWGGDEGQQRPARKPTMSFSSTIGNKRPSLRFVDVQMNLYLQEKRVIFEPPPYEEPTAPLFDHTLLEQFQMNVYYYAELLFRWQMYHKRLELLNATSSQLDSSLPEDMDVEPHKLGLHRLCMRQDCRNILPDKVTICQYCHTPCAMPACTVCRLPVKGLARTCVLCAHTTHISCWNSLEVTVPICPSGCGCFCSPTDLPFTRPSTRLGLTPPMSTLLLSTDLGYSG
ncbi:hypothetical protein CPB83DRAFT_856798 [Crepidotus variabilis]|uniref:WDR59/RTC1-like RING zinc finger domain-containing protein n=1 Tax=Crepidotus variabilis TaxID=179855 RepID=A0A9P6JNT5_9AGAR|nr:hypothetical protein CPB83DRAFT_856798 [Crepidotus variabilis]